MTFPNKIIFMSHIEYYCTIIPQCGICTFYKEWKKVKDLELDALIFELEILKKERKEGKPSFNIPPTAQVSFLKF